MVLSDAKLNLNQTTRERLLKKMPQGRNKVTMCKNVSNHVYKRNNWSSSR